MKIPRKTRCFCEINSEHGRQFVEFVLPPFFYWMCVRFISEEAQIHDPGILYCWDVDVECPDLCDLILPWISLSHRLLLLLMMSPCDGEVYIQERDGNR